MKRYPVMLCLIWVFVAGWAHPQAGGSPSAALTLHRLAEMLIPALSLENKLPKTLVALTPEEACRMECGVLAGNGLPMFAGADCNRCVSRGFMAEVLFRAVQSPSAAAGGHSGGETANHGGPADPAGRGGGRLPGRAGG